MLCVVDVGNTHTVIGLYDGESLEENWRLRTDKGRTSDEWGLTFKTLLSLKGREIEIVSAVVISSVVPHATVALKNACERYFHVTPLVVGPGVRTGLPILYESPREVGADRVVNAVAGFACAGGACIIVDFGTATTFDCISSAGEYLGGVISPGVITALDALVTKTAKLPRVEIAEPRSAIGRNTVESMQSGILYGYVSMVDGLVARLTDEMACDVTVIATGGLAGVIADKSTAIDRVEPHLTLYGLRLIYEKNMNP
jgi:type III pantothenate kinase